MILAGCTSQTTPASTTTTQNSAAGSSQPVQATLSPYQDALFQSTVIESAQALNLTMSKVADDGMNMDMAACKEMLQPSTPRQARTMTR